MVFEFVFAILVSSILNLVSLTSLSQEYQNLRLYVPECYYCSYSSRCICPGKTFECSHKHECMLKSHKSQLNKTLDHHGKENCTTRVTEGYKTNYARFAKFFETKTRPDDLIESVHELEPLSDILWSIINHIMDYLRDDEEAKKLINYRQKVDVSSKDPYCVNLVPRYINNYVFRAYERDVANLTNLIRFRLDKLYCLAISDPKSKTRSYVLYTENTITNFRKTFDYFLDKTSPITNVKPNTVDPCEKHQYFMHQYNSSCFV